MPEVQPHPEHPEGGRKYGAFQMVSPRAISLLDGTFHLYHSPPPQEIYKDGLLKNKLPTVTTDPNALEAQAKKHLGARSFNYIAGGASERATMDANRLAFRQWKVRPMSPCVMFTSHRIDFQSR